jgi:serine/threonine-protein kinase HipA
MTPVYDVLSVLPLLSEGPKLVSSHKVSMAMAVRGKNAHYKMHDIQPRRGQRYVTAVEPLARPRLHLRCLP